MNNLKEYILEKFKINKDTKIQEYHYYPKDKDELKDLIEKLIEERGNEADLNDIDTSKITDMSNLFYKSEFNGDISSWDVNNVNNMIGMFANSKFNGDISSWNVKHVIYMMSMFSQSDFNGDITSWNVNSNSRVDNIFYKCPLEKNPPKWYKNGIFFSK